MNSLIFKTPINKLNKRHPEIDSMNKAEFYDPDTNVEKQSEDAALPRH